MPLVNAGAFGARVSTHAAADQYPNGDSNGEPQANVTGSNTECRSNSCAQNDSEANLCFIHRKLHMQGGQERPPHTGYSSVSVAA